MTQPVRMALLRLLPALPADRPARVALVALAAIGAGLLAVVATTRWGTAGDELSYWLAAERLAAGEPLYDPTANLTTPEAYLYPPPLAQVLAPLTAVISGDLFTVGWTVLLLSCLYWLGGRNAFVALAFVAFIPVAVELWWRNIHLILAVLIVMGLRRGGWWFAVAAAIKMTPALGILYLASRGRLREAAMATTIGAALLAASVALSPEAWRQFVDVIVRPAADSGAGIIPVPFWVRGCVGAALAVVAGRLHPRVGEPLLVVGLVFANPSFHLTALSMLVAIVPLWRTRPMGGARVGIDPAAPTTSSTAATQS